jgi:Transposase DDE domain
MDSPEFHPLRNSSITIGHQDGDFWYISIPRETGTQFLAFSTEDKNTPDLVKHLIAWFEETEKLEPLESISLRDYQCSVFSDETADIWRRFGKNAVPPDDPGNPTVDFHGEKRSNQTHASKTDPDAKMARKGKGKEAKLSYNGNLLVENRNGLIVNAEVFEANGTAERDAALVMLEQIPGTKQVTVGGDKAYDTADFVAECRNLKVTPHVAQNLERPGGSAIDARTTQHPGYAISQRKRKRIEECFGWLKTIALLRKLRHRGIFKVGWNFTFAAAVYNLVRLRNLTMQAT